MLRKRAFQESCWYSRRKIHRRTARTDLSANYRTIEVRSRSSFLRPVAARMYRLLQAVAVAVMLHLVLLVVVMSVSLEDRRFPVYSALRIPSCVPGVRPPDAPQIGLLALCVFLLQSIHYMLTISCRISSRRYTLQDETTLPLKSETHSKSQSLKTYG